MKKVLLVEDDPNIVGLLEIHLKDLDCELICTTNGLDGLDLGLKNKYDLIILDIMLPQMDGIDVCRQLRAVNIKTPILMLTAKSEEIDKILGLETGADDYLTKPFSIREFIARVKAIFRRVQMLEEDHESQSSNFISHGDLKVDKEMRKVTLSGKRLELTPKEFDLLCLLASNPGKSYSRAKILRLVWGYEFEGYEHTVNSHINRLRSKIEADLHNPSYILTTWGVGYRFSEEQ